MKSVSHVLDIDTAFGIFNENKFLQRDKSDPTLPDDIKNITCNIIKWF